MFCNIITMAGLGSRFRKAGYNVPKFMITAKEKTLFEWSMESLNDFKSNSKYIFIIRDESGVEDFIKEKCNEMGIEKYEIIKLDHLTSGQAETAKIAVEKCDPQDEILIYNIDTYINPKYFKKEDIKGDGCIPCFNAPGEHWSFAKTDENGKVIDVREKIKISDNASVGAYYFKSAAEYIRIYEEYYKNDSNIEKGEKYIAPMYNQLIKENKDVRITIIPYEAVKCLGTPEELDIFIKS